MVTSLPGARRPCHPTQAYSGAQFSESFWQRCGRMLVSTAVATKSLVAQETAGWGEGGGARQLALNNAWSANTISPQLVRAARNWNCLLGSKTPGACPSSDQSALLRKGRQRWLGLCSNATFSERPTLAIPSRTATPTLHGHPLPSFSAYISAGIYHAEQLTQSSALLSVSPLEHELQEGRTGFHPQL